jgi:hypothetical protein
MNHPAELVVALFLALTAFYLACGLGFALPFVMFGARRIDSHAAQGSWGFRLLIIPGAVALWPLLLRRWVKGNQVPPEEETPHRVTARDGGQPQTTPHRS